MVTMATKFFTVGNKHNHGNQVGLNCLCTLATKLFAQGNHDNYDNKIVYCRTKMTKGIAGFRHKGSMDIF
jgi:hypothetical protein